MGECVGDGGSDGVKRGGVDELLSDGNCEGVNESIRECLSEKMCL